MFSKTGENSVAEYWSARQGEKFISIRRSKVAGHHPICMTCVAIKCEHVKAFNNQLNPPLEPWETQAGLTINEPG